MSLFAMFKSAGPTGLRLRVDGGAGDRRALAHRPDDSGDRLQFRDRAGGVSGARAAGGPGARDRAYRGERLRRRARRFPARRSATPASSQTLHPCEGASQRSRQTVTGSTPSFVTRAS